MRHLQLIASAAVLVAGTAAFAQSIRYTATLAQPVAARKEYVANGNVWRCETSTCILVSNPEDPSSVRSCHALERQAGSLTAYGTSEKPFDSDKLAKCNGQ